MFAGPATADTERCLSHNEFDNLYYGMSRIEVFNLVDIYGNYLGDSADQGQYRVGYNICWSDERRAVLRYSYDTGGLEEWNIRDR